MDTTNSNRFDEDFSEVIVENRKKPTVAQVIVFYTVIILLFLTWSELIGNFVNVKGIYEMILMVVQQIVLFLLPSILFLKIFGYKIKFTLRLNRVTAVNTMVTLFIFFFSYPTAYMINYLYMVFFNKYIGKIVTRDIPLESGMVGFFINMFVIAVCAGICEEVLFRGVIQRGFEDLGYIKAAVIAGTLFALMHFSIDQIAGLLYLGIVMGLIVYRTNSIYLAMLFHFLNNAIAVSMQSLQEYLPQNFIKDDKEALIQEMLSPDSVELTTVIIMAIFLLIVVVAFIALLFLVTKDNFKEQEEKRRIKIKEAVLFIFPMLIIGIVTYLIRKNM